MYTYTSPVYTEPRRCACSKGEDGKPQDGPTEGLDGHELSTEGYGWFTDTLITFPNHVEHYHWSKLEIQLVSL